MPRAMNYYAMPLLPDTRPCAAAIIDYADDASSYCRCRSMPPKDDIIIIASITMPTRHSIAAMPPLMRHICPDMPIAAQHDGVTRRRCRASARAQRRDARYFRALAASAARRDVATLRATPPPWR